MPTPFDEEEITVVEEKYPIKFSLGQFILLLGVEVVVLALVFLLGARFGGSIFNLYHQERIASQRAYQGLAPDQGNFRGAPPAPAKLVDTPEEANAQDAGEGASGQEGEEEAENPMAQQEAEALPPPPEKLQVNKSLFHSSADKNTMIRFKSSDSSKFAIEVGKYFDELLASKQLTKLKQKGYEAYLVIENAHDAAPSYGVRVGSFGDRKMAEDFAVKMSNEQGLELRVVQVD